MDFADNVIARRCIEQSPLTDAPSVPKGTRGHIDDYDEPFVLVDFGEPYGVVLCDLDEVA
jgi:hypothetical protein